MTRWTLVGLVAAGLVAGGCQRHETSAPNASPSGSDTLPSPPSALRAPAREPVPPAGQAAPEAPPPAPSPTTDETTAGPTP